MAPLILTTGRNRGLPLHLEKLARLSVLSVMSNSVTSAAYEASPVNFQFTCRRGFFTEFAGVSLTELFKSIPFPTGSCVVRRRTGIAMAGNIIETGLEVDVSISTNVCETVHVTGISLSMYRLKRQDRNLYRLQRRDRMCVEVDIPTTVVFTTPSSESGLINVHGAARRLYPPGSKPGGGANHIESEVSPPSASDFCSHSCPLSSAPSVASDSSSSSAPASSSVWV